jgi:hypothetical protein
MVLGSGTDRALRELPTAGRVVASAAEVQCGDALGQRACRQKTTNLSSIPPIRRRHPIWPPAPPRFFTDVGFLPPRGSAIRVATRSTRRRRQQLRPPSPSCPGLLCLSAFVQDDGTLRSEHMLPAPETSADPILELQPPRSTTNWPMHENAFAELIWGVVDINLRPCCCKIRSPGPRAARFDRPFRFNTSGEQ